MGSVQFILAMGVVQLYYPGYSLTENAVSDLGGSSSPLAWLFNSSVRALGVLAIAGLVLVYGAFRPRWSTRIGVAAFIIAAVGAFGVGTFPEGSPELGGAIHGVMSLVTFLFSGIGLVVFGFAMVRDTRWDGYRLYTLVSGAVTLVALTLSAVGWYPVLGPGGMERLIIAPVLLWGIVVGTHLLRLKTYVPGASRTGSAPQTFE